MKKIIIFILLTIPLFSLKSAEIPLSEKLSGKILLQVESHGEAWYIYPDDKKRYFLGKPQNAFDIMRSLGLGITNLDLKKIPIGYIKIDDYADNDNDGLHNDFEILLGTDPNKKDSDNDGYDDMIEILNNQSPIENVNNNLDYSFAEKNSGKIFLQIENNGEAWYVNPKDKKRYYLGRPHDAFQIMRTLGLGITNENLEKIQIPSLVYPPGYLEKVKDKNTNVIESAAQAFREKNKTVTKYFIPEMKKSLEYTIDNMTRESLLMLGNILSGSSLSKSTSNEKIYTNKVYYRGDMIPIEFIIRKQENGNWLMTNL